MLDIKECTNGEVWKYPVSRNRNPESASASKGLPYNGVDRTSNFVQLKG
jgi:hypothetical protein